MYMIKTAAFLLSFFLTLVIFPYYISRLKRKGIVGTDIYKVDKRKVAERGGLLVLVLSASIVFAFSFFIGFSLIDWMIIAVICAFGIYGLIDDTSKFSRLANFLIPF